MVPPLFRYESGDLQIYRDLEALVADTEKIDVDQLEYVFWDANGSEFDLNTDLWPAFFVKLDNKIVVPPVRSLGVGEIGRIIESYCIAHGIEAAGGVTEMTRAIGSHLSIVE